MIEADQRNRGGIVKELGRLTNLTALGIVKLRKEDGATLCSSIENLNNLCELDVTSTQNNEILDLQYLSPVPKFLQLLNGHLTKFPHWIPSVHGLATLHLRWSK
ncbi:hypothetical protein CsSME_00049635 [Camellia sinensis var. sinensis]